MPLRVRRLRTAINTVNFQSALLLLLLLRPLLLLLLLALFIK